MAVMVPEQKQTKGVLLIQEANLNLAGIITALHDKVIGASVQTRLLNEFAELANLIDHSSFII